MGKIEKTEVKGKIAENVVRKLYENEFGEPDFILVLPGAGSDRKYFRIGKDGSTIVATYGQDARENRAFIDLANIFRKKGINVPEILGNTPDSMAYLQQDIGDTSLAAMLNTEGRLRLSKEALSKLTDMQTVDRNSWKNAVFQKPFSLRQIMWDLNYFKYDFLKPCGIVFDEDELENDFHRLAARIENRPAFLNGFMYRDFQSRNIMVHNDELWFIDFQGGRLGPVGYDAVSFTYQVKAAFSEDEKTELLNHYAECIGKKKNIDPETVLKEMQPLILLRGLQVAGAYGFRGLIEKKAHFLDSLNGGIKNLVSMQSKGFPEDFPELNACITRCERWREENITNPDSLQLTVTSFSFKKGYPSDFTGNGGGFVFDCRGMHNPGRYEQYKQLTGLDKEVVGFLKERGETDRFIAQAEDIVMPVLKKYKERGFTSLQVAFGCTGGRHRSVYCAEGLAKKIKEKMPECSVMIVHREQDIMKTL